ncbi:exocyst complex component EXO70H1-like protein [Tanacetum coccineum]|uniref:Exocyst subunit Exo70 family protein n=1 Tax=Tanacetum coccineum TaxID=301880 RepID=A0ABQ4XLY4_9ASTR
MSISKTTSRLTREAKKLFSFTTTNTTSSASSPSSLRSSTSSPYSSSSSECMMEENIKNAHVIIQKWEIKGHFISIFHHDTTEEATNFVNCVKRLHRAMSFLASHDSVSEKLTLAQGLMQIAMKRLETEFRLILLNIGEYLQPDQSVSISWSASSVDSEDEQLSSLRLIAETMISCGYGVECIDVYKIIRKSTIDEALFHLGIHEHFFSYQELKNTPLVKFLDDGTLHNSITDLWPEIESIFSNESVSSVKILALESLQKLAKSVRRVLSKLELSIHKNSSKITVSASGGIHPLNDSVMNYLSSLANYGSSLSDIIIGYNDLPVEQQSLAVFPVKLSRSFLVHLFKLERKAKFMIPPAIVSLS